MTDPNGWPDASKPGVPLNPERDGWQWMVSVHFTSCPPTPVAWDAAQRTYLRADEIHDVDFAARNWRYLGPCLTPAEVAAMLAEAEARGREAGLREAAGIAAGEAFNIPDDPYGEWLNGFVAGCTRIAAAIRAAVEPPT